MQFQKALLTGAVVVEAPAALFLILIPEIFLRIVLGAVLDSVGAMTGRIGGMALLALVVTCWGARNDPGGDARTGTIRAITLYNGSIVALFILFAMTGQANGLGLWIVGLVHLVFTIAFIAAQRWLPNKAATDSRGRSAT